MTAPFHEPPAILGVGTPRGKAPAPGLRSAAAAVRIRGSPAAAMQAGFVEVVLPSRAPGELGLDQFLEVGAIEQVAECPSGCEVSDHENPVTAPATREIGQEPTDSVNRLLPALTAKFTHENTPLS